MHKKFLFSKTKIEILKKLNERNYTVSELSKILGKSKSTISEHLNALYKMGLVDKESHSKWVYYKITTKGKKVLENLEALILMVGVYNMCAFVSTHAISSPYRQ